MKVEGGGGDIEGGEGVGDVEGGEDGGCVGCEGLVRGQLDNEVLRGERVGYLC